jgi:hypothetical protein
VEQFDPFGQLELHKSKRHMANGSLLQPWPKLHARKVI